MLYAIGCIKPFGFYRDPQYSLPVVLLLHALIHHQVLETEDQPMDKIKILSLN